VQVDVGFAARQSAAVEVARAYLETGATGKSCAHLALQLAAAVMSLPLVEKAMAVLAGGPHVHSRATELAAQVLTQANGGALAPTSHDLSALEAERATAGRAS
jgi:hypothetical protein